MVGDVVAACNFERSEIQRGVARRFWVTREKSAIQPCGMQATNPLDSNLHCPPPHSRSSQILPTVISAALSTIPSTRPLAYSHLQNWLCTLDTH